MQVVPASPARTPIGIEPGAVGQDGQADAEHSGEAGEDGAPGHALGEQRDAEPGDEQGLGGAEHCGHATREPVRADEQQREEGSDVERAEDRRAPPPLTAGQSSSDGHEEQTGGQGAQRCRQQRAPRREQLCGGDVRRAPDDGRESCDDAQCGASHGTSLDLKYLDTEKDAL
jgi:hypothetical protein